MLTPHGSLRQLLGEEIPADGSESDTLFTDADIEGFLTSTGDDVEGAALMGWRVKAAKLSSLVDNTEGNTSRKLSQAHDQALEMVKMYSRRSGGNTEGRTRVGRARRKGVEW